MSVIARKVHYSYEEYLSLERDFGLRFEYLDGEIYAMAGGTPEHSYLSARVVSLFDRAVPAGCRVASSDRKIAIQASGLYTYPDAAIICGPEIPDIRDRNAVTNPTVLVEVTSHGTEDYDLGAKLAHYQRIDSLQCVVFVSHRMRRITVVSRTETAWDTQSFDRGSIARLKGPVNSLEVDALYSVVSHL